jgi:hypothetical protein
MAEALPELAVRHGHVPAGDVPQGECIITSLPGGGIRVDHADPRVLISGELLESIARFGDSDPSGGWLALNAQLDTTDCCDCMMQDDYTKAVLKISAVNRTVIYRIVTYVPSVHGYIAEWPD